MTPPLSPLPSPRMSMKVWWSILSDIARRSSGLSKGGAFRLTSRLRGTFPVYMVQIAAAPGSLHPSIAHRDAEIHVVIAGDEGKQPRGHILDDPMFDAVKMGPPGFPVIRIARHLDHLVGPELDKFERAGADGVGPHVARADMTGINRRPAGGQHLQNGRLRLFQVK